MPRSRIPEGKAFHLVDSSYYRYYGKACMFCSHPTLSGNTTCMSYELYITQTMCYHIILHWERCCTPTLGTLLIH